MVVTAKGTVKVVVRASMLFALWLLLTDAVDRPDLITGGSVALLVSALATALQESRPDRARPRLVMFRYCYRPMILLVTDTIRVMHGLLGGLLRGHLVTGRLLAAPYRATGDVPDHAARRVATEWAASQGPNRYVIGIDPDRRLLIVHELVSATGALDPLELG